MDKYTKVRTIGKGSYGFAILVRNNLSNKLYIMKVIDIAALDRKQKEEALNEIHVLRAMRHPYIVTYVESFLEKRCLCIVMEYADGGDLYSRLGRLKANKESVPEAVVLDWFVQICLAMKYIHDRKILHRDLKSQNIFLTAKDEIKVGDFGIARVLQNTYDYANTVIGTPYYLSPEMCQELPYNQKSDIWSLGCILYEMLTCKHAFSASNMKGLVLKILRGTYEPIPDTYSQQVRDLVAELLQREPVKRPSVKRILEKDFLRARIPGLLARTVRLHVSSRGSSSQASTKSTGSLQSEPHVSSPVQPSKGDMDAELEEDVLAAVEEVRSSFTHRSKDSEELPEGQPLDHVKVPGLSASDSPPCKVECLRLYLERVFGLPDFLAVYRYLQGRVDASTQELSRRLQRFDVRSIQLIKQLLVAEEAAYA